MQGARCGLHDHAIPLAPAAIIENLYLSIYSRRPTEAESKNAAALFEKEGATRRQVIEDLMWALLNTPEFVFKD